MRTRKNRVGPHGRPAQVEIALEGGADETGRLLRSETGVGGNIAECVLILLSFQKAKDNGQNDVDDRKDHKKGNPAGQPGVVQSACGGGTGRNEADDIADEGHHQEILDDERGDDEDADQSREGTAGDRAVRRLLPCGYEKRRRRRADRRRLRRRSFGGISSGRT